MEGVIGIIALGAILLNVVLFFKIWGMNNDIWFIKEVIRTYDKEKVAKDNKKINDSYNINLIAKNIS